MALILRAADRRGVPWKNGGGLTREVAAHPAGSDLGNFDWRVSLAEVRCGGPFSCFPGIDRQLAVLSGRLQLSIAGRDAQGLSSDTPAISFSGEVPVYAEPRQEPVTDLNVMTRRGRFVARLTRRGAQASTEVILAADTTLLLALAPLTLHAPGIAASLAALDGVQFSDSAQTLTVQPAAAAADFWLIEIDACRRSEPA